MAQSHPALTPTDEEHLRLLSVFHYVVGGMAFLFCSFPLIYLALGIAMLTGQLHDAGGNPAQFGWFFVALGGFMTLLGWALAVLTIIAAGRLKQRRSHTFCMVIAGALCMFMPVGTALGVFTLIVLVRPGVKQGFSVT